LGHTKKLSAKANSIIDTVREIILDEPRISFAFLFGSYAADRATSLSDIDLAVYFQEMSEDEKIDIEHRLWLLFDETVNVLRLEEDDISPLVRLKALEGEPILIRNQDVLNRFTLSIIHRATEAEVVLGRLRKIS